MPTALSLQPLLFVLASEPSGVSAHEPERTASGPGEHGKHHAEHPNLLGIKFGPLFMFEPEHDSEHGRGVATIPAIYFGVFYERVLIHNWLELEITIPVAVTQWPETKVLLPADIHFKKPFHPVDWVSPYIAIGPTFDLLAHPEVRMFFGGSVGVGTYLWMSSRWGVDVELDYNIVAEEGVAVHELLLAVGPVARF